MTTLLHIDSSILGEKSTSRGLTAEIVEKFRRDIAGLEVVYRDLAAAAPPELSSAYFFARAAGAEPEDPALARSLAAGRAFTDEFLRADIVVIGAPLYNFTIPTQLRSWIDHIVVPGKTFAYTAEGIKGLAGGRRVIVVSTRGGSYESGPRAGSEHQESYLRSVFANIGVTDIEIVRAEGLSIGPQQKDEAIAAARREIAALRAA